MRLPVLLLLACALAPAAHAQAPQAVNAPPLPSAEAERLAAFRALLGRAGGTPDTTAPWRYYPLHVGDAWEYEDFLNGRVTRREVEGDTLLGGRRYFRVRHRQFDPDGTLLSEQVHPIRFDTLSSIVRWSVLGAEQFYYLAPCPFDAPFNAIVGCYGGVLPMETSGGYDGVLVFEEGGQTDTLRDLSVKRYQDAASFYSFVGGFGLVLLGGKGPDNYALYYARIEGVEYGEPRYPTAAEPEPPQAAALAVWPNPARGRARVAFTPEAGEPMLLALYDALGRRVFTREVMGVPHVRAEAALDLAGLAPGVYVVRLDGAREGAAARLTVLR